MHVLSLTAWLTAFLVALVTGMTASRPHAPHTRLTLRLTLRPCSACQQDQCAGAIRLREGQRVVRGPDWKWGRQDGPDEVSPPSSLCCYLLFPLFVVVAFRAALPSLPADPSCFFFPGMRRCRAPHPIVGQGKAGRFDVACHGSRVMGLVVGAHARGMGSGQVSGEAPSGVVVEVKGTGWCKVRWSTGVQETYRAGAEGGTRLRFLVPVCADECAFFAVRCSLLLIAAVCSLGPMLKMWRQASMTWCHTTWKPLYLSWRPLLLPLKMRLRRPWVCCSCS